MKYLVRIVAPTLIFLFFFLVMPAIGQEDKVTPSWKWKGRLADGTIITMEDLRKIFADHKKWLQTKGKEGQRAYLGEANLTSAYLRQANLTKAYLRGANLTNTNSGGVNLTSAILVEANLTSASLEGANLTSALLRGANLTKAFLSGADLTGAFLVEANLTGAYLWGANLTSALLWGADLTEAIYEPKPGSVPNIPYLTNVKNLSTLTFHKSPHGLIELREGFKKAGLREQERKITYAIERTKRVKWTSANPFSMLFSKKEDKQQSSEQESSFLKKLGRETLGWIYYGLAEFTCKYGMSPWRPLLLLVLFIPLFSIPYVLCLRKESKDGIWKVWNPERRRKDLGEEKSSKPLRLRGWPAIRVGFYFSILSAFSIGWRELNVGNWIARIQRYEYNYRATGWARTVSGIQSLLSVSLLALWVLTYFGRPFE